jgi:hypothetical protein
MWLMKMLRLMFYFSFLDGIAVCVVCHARNHAPIVLQNVAGFGARAYYGLQAGSSIECLLKIFIRETSSSCRLLLDEGLIKN